MPNKWGAKAGRVKHQLKLKTKTEENYISPLDHKFPLKCRGKNKSNNNAWKLYPKNIEIFSKTCKTKPNINQNVST